MTTHRIQYSRRQSSPFIVHAVARVFSTVINLFPQAWASSKESAEELRRRAVVRRKLAMAMEMDDERRARRRSARP